jgi:hypothetical protein
VIDPVDAADKAAVVVGSTPNAIDGSSVVVEGA